MRWILSAILIWSCTAMARVVVTHGVPHLQQVEDGFYRGGRLRPGGMEYLKSLGVKTIINLEQDDDGVLAEERAAADQLGIRQISVPMAYRSAPTDETIDQLLADLQNPALRPIYLHCKHGKDRTGLVVALYRVEVQGWAAAAAYQEMLELGFARFWRRLEQYFRARVQFFQAAAA